MLPTYTAKLAHGGYKPYVMKGLHIKSYSYCSTTSATCDAPTFHVTLMQELDFGKGSNSLHMRIAVLQPSLIVDVVCSWPCAAQAISA